MSSTLPLQVLNIRLYCIVIIAVVLLSRKIVGITKGVEVACARARLRFEAVCKKSGVVHPSPHLNHPKFYQKIANALASYWKALIHVYDMFVCLFVCFN